MKRLRGAFEALCVVFSMYSAVPVPTVEWTAGNMRYAMGLLPAVGLVVGALLCALAGLAEAANTGVILRAALAAALPLCVTGGVHLDGFCDTADALASHAARERKLEILKDPHIGAFGVMRCILLLLTTFALWCRLSWTWPQILALSVGFVLSRALSGLAVVTFPCAKNSGLVHAFHSAAHKRVVRRMLLTLIALCAAALAVLVPLYGTAVLLGAAAAALYCRQVILRQFGGISGDLAGYAVLVCEWAMLAGCGSAEILFSVIKP